MERVTPGTPEVRGPAPVRVWFYTGGFTHTLYREQLRAMPESVTVTASSSELYGEGIKEDLRRSRNITSALGAAVHRHAVRTLTNLRVPNVRLVRAPDVDLIHSAQYPLLNRRPWVVDFEDASVFAWYDPPHLRHARTQRLLRTVFEGDFCRGVLPWTTAARDSLLNAMDCSSFAEKIQILYPAIAPRRQHPPHNHGGTVRLLFVGSAFFEKGGVETLEAFRLLRERGIDATLTMVSDVPEDVRGANRSLDGLTILSRIPPALLQSLYERADLFIAPMHTDTFGFVLLEAFAYGIPCVVTDQFATPEIVSHGVNGVVIPNYESRFGADRLPRYSPQRGGNLEFRQRLMTPPRRYVEQLASEIDALVRDPVRRGQLGQAALGEVVSGRFSIESRRAALSELYRSAVERGR